MTEKRTEKEILEELRKLHEVLKEHEFRKTMRGWNDYSEKLEKFARLFSDLGYNCIDISKEKGKMIESAANVFLHNFVEALGYSRDNEIPERQKYLIPYYERMLQVIHRFLDAETLEFIYRLENLGKDENKHYIYGTEKYEFLTKETVEFENELLPGFFRIKKENVEEEVKKTIEYMEKYPDIYDKEHREKRISRLMENEVPIMEWINKNRFELEDESKGKIDEKNKND